MAKVSVPFLHIYQSRSGTTFAYYRRNGRRIRLQGEPGSAEFLRSYQEAQAKVEADVGPRTVPDRPGYTPGSVGALIASYRVSQDWQALKPATRKDYAKGLASLEPYARGPVALLRRGDVRRIQQELAAVPSRANKATVVLSILLQHAIELGWITSNPALRLRKIATGGDGYRTWTPVEVARFMERSDPYWRFAALLAVCTGQRGQDLVTMRRDAYDGATFRVVQAKTGAALWLPAHPHLRAALSGPPVAPGLYLLPRPNGLPWSANAFQKAAGQAIRAAGLEGVVWHGLRATAASWLAEAGCSDAEIMSITGHTTTRMVQHYRRGAEQKRLATGAVAKLRLRHVTDES